MRLTAMVRNAIVASGILPDVEGAHPAARKERPNFHGVAIFRSLATGVRLVRRAGSPAPWLARMPTATLPERDLQVASTGEGGRRDEFRTRGPVCPPYYGEWRR
jgi:hypothetical protein